MIFFADYPVKNAMCFKIYMKIFTSHKFRKKYLRASVFLIALLLLKSTEVKVAQKNEVTNKKSRWKTYLQNTQNAK